MIIGADDVTLHFLPFGSVYIYGKTGRCSNLVNLLIKAFRKIQL